MVIVLVITLIEQTENAAELTIQSRHSYIHVFVKFGQILDPNDPLTKIYFFSLCRREKGVWLQTLKQNLLFIHSM